jgi:hypothetical protein
LRDLRDDCASLARRRRRSPVAEHEYFHAVHGADDATRRAYLDRAYRLGLEF